MEPWVKTSYETMAPKTFTITFQYAQENEDYPDDSGKETQAALEAQEKALNEYLQTDEYKALVAEADALVKNQLEEDLEDVRLFLGTLLGTVSVPNNGYYDFPRTSGGKNLTFVNLIEEAANAADLYGYAEKAINALNAWRLERVAENPETATFATFSLQALQYYYNAIKPSENRDYVKQYRQIEALINSVNSLKDVNNLSDLNTADTPKIEEKKKVADNIYEIMNRIKFAEGVTPATPEKVRELVYEYYQLYGNLTDGIWMQEETVKTSKGRTLWKILEDVAAETETLTFEYYGQTIYRLLDRMVEQGKTLNDGTQLRTTEEWYEIVAEMRKSSSEKEKEIFDRVLYTVILYTCMDEATTSEKDKETVISLPNAAETLFMTREELAIFAQIFYDKIKERNGGYYPFDYTLSVYGEFFGTQSDERTSYIAANAESIIGSAVNIQNNATYSSGIAGTRPSVIKANLAQYFANIFASVDGLPTDDGFVKVITDADKKASDAGLSGDDAGAYSLYVLFNYVYGQNNSVTYPNNDVEMHLTNAWNAYNAFVNGTGTDGSGYVINGKTLTWFELLCGRETDKGYVADRNSAFVNAYTFLADKSDYESENTPYDEIYNAVYSDFRAIYSEVMVPGASLSDITGINDIIKKTEGIAYDAQYTDFVKLAKLVAESYDTAVKNLSALDESYGLTEEDIAVYAGMLAVREILCAVYGADSINLTLRGAVSNFAIVKVFSEFTSYVLDTKVGESDYSTIFNMTGALDATFYDDYILYPNERTGAVKTIFDGITAIQNKEIAFRDAVESYVVNIFVETDALTALFNELNAKLGKDVNSFINENIENGYKAAAEFVGLITSKDYGVTGLTDIVRAVFAGYASETDTPVYLVYKYNRYRNLLSVDFENLYNALNSSADETDKSFVEGYTEIVGGTDLEKALALIELVGAISGQDYEIADGTAKELYENAYAVINMCYNASTYLTEEMWKSYYGGVSLENLADYFDEAYKAVTSDTTDKALIEALDEATKKELEDAYSLQATSQNDNIKAKAMFTLVNVIPADTEFNSVKAKTVIDKAREVLDRCEITEESFDCTATEWRKQYGGPESDYPQIIEALERKTLLENINSGSADKPLEELIEELLGSLEFTDMADYLDEYIDTVKYNARKETNDFAESTEMIERAFAKTYNAAAETRKDIAEIDLGAGVELSKIYVGAEVDPDGIRDDLVPELEQSEYVDYDKMQLYLSFGGFFSFGFGEGRTDIAEIVNIVFGSLNISEIYLEFLKTHIMYGSLKAEIALDIAKALSEDEEQVKESLAASIVMEYALIDNDERGETKRFEQQVIAIYVYNGSIYLSIELLDMKLNLQLEFDAMSYLLGLLGITEEEETATENLSTLNAAISSIMNGWDGEAALEKGTPLGQLLNASATKNSKDVLEALIRIDSGEAGLILTVDILLEALNLLLNDNEATDQLNDLILMIFTSGSVKVEYGEDFGINLNISKNRTITGDKNTSNNLSYDINLGLLNDTVFSMNSVNPAPDAKDYFGDFLIQMESRQDSGYFDGFYKMTLDLLGMLNAGSTGATDFDLNEIIADVVGDRLQIGLSIELDSEVLRTAVDWSKLFSAMGALSVEPIFIMRVLNSAEGAIRFDINMDLDISKVNFDVSLRAYNNGVNIFNVYELSGTLNTDNDPEFSPKFYFDMGDVGPEKFVVTAQSLYDFMKINFMEFVLDFLGGEHDEIEVERADNAGLFGGEDTSVDIADLDFGKVLQSLTFGQGTLGLMLSEALLNTLIKLIDANWEFDDMGNIRFDADLMQNVIEITVPLDAAVRDADGNILSDSKLNYAVRLSNINVHIGEAVDFIASTGKTDFSAFDEYKDISSYVWITEVNSSLGLYNDDENTIVDLTDLTMRFISGLGIKLRNGEALLDVSLDFVLRTYIDFSDLGNLGFELLINRRGRTLIGLTFIGAENDGSLYINLEGLGFNKFYITGVDIGSMLTEVLKSLEQDVSFGDEETAANSDGSISGSISSGDKGAIDYGDISDAGISTNLLLALFDENKFNVAMTGALLLNLLGTLEGIRDISAMIPMFANIQIGYEKDKLSGIKFVYDEGQHFSIDYSFEKSYTYLVPKRDLNDIANTAYDDARMHMVKSTDKTDFVNIDNLKNVNIGLTLDLTLTTVNADGSKSEPVEQFEALLENLLGMKEGSVDLQFQDMYAAITLSVEIIADLTNLNNSKLKVEIIYNEETLIGIYYLDGAVYLDLGELGLMKAAINGVDLIGALTYFIGGELPIDLDEEKGLDIQGLITGLLNTGIEESEKGTTEKTNTSIEEQAVEDAIEVLKENYLTRYENGEFDDLTATEQEEIKAEIESALMTINTDNGNVLTESEFDSVYKEIVRSIGFRVQGSIIQEVTDSQNTAIISLLLYDDRIEITPTADSLSALLGMEIPEFQGMLISMNLDAGFTNLMLNVNMDGDNRMTVSMPEEGGIRLGFNLTDAEINSKMGDINTDGFGGINGLFVGANGISVDIEKLGDGLLDTLDIDNEINIEKRGDYWTRRDLYSIYPYVNDSGPTYYADDFAGYDGDDAELFTAIIKIIKIAKIIYDVIDAIKTLADTIRDIVATGGIGALWSVGNIIKLVMKIYDIISGVNDFIDETNDIDDQHYPELSRNNYSRGRVLVNRMTNNVLELELAVR